MRVAAGAQLRIGGEATAPFEIVARVVLRTLQRRLDREGLVAVGRARMRVLRPHPAFGDAAPTVVVAEVDAESVRSSPPTDGPSNRAGIPLSQASSQGEPPA